MTDHEHPDDQIEWPREIWMGEREEHDQGVVTAVLSEWATVARWEGDKERDREFHRYVDADIHESAERYYKARIAAAEAAAYRKAAEWRTDMENAPRDGTDIYLGAAPQTYMGEAVPARSTIGHWATDEECRTYTGDCGGECRCPEYEYVEPNWISWDGGFTNENPPTHWREIMPTPDADAILALADLSALDEALAAEREKCAKTVEALTDACVSDDVKAWAKDRAAAIRKGDQA